MPQSQPKVDPRTAQDGLKTAQESHKRPPSRARMSQNQKCASGFLQLQTALENSEMIPRQPTRASKGPKNPPTRPQTVQ
eukprot:6630250-Pyramimonas_sp.AAC.1